jgi:hypothetical protein
MLNFASSCKASSIGSLEIRISPVFGGASTLKPRKITTSQETRDDQHRLRDRGDRLRCQQRPNLAELRSEGYGLVFELALRVVMW